MGKPAFVEQSLPLYSLKALFLLEQISIILNMVHCATGYVFLIMNDNLKRNQSFFDLMNPKYGTITKLSVNPPIQNPDLQQIFSP